MVNNEVQDCLNNLILICDILGVNYDINVLNSFNNTFFKMCYLFECIYKFLGGK